MSEVLSGQILSPVGSQRVSVSSMPSIDSAAEGQVPFGSVMIPTKDNMKADDTERVPMFKMDEKANRRMTIISPNPVMFYMHYVKRKGEPWSSYVRCTKHSLGDCPICQILTACKEKGSQGEQFKKAKDEAHKARTSRRYFLIVADWKLAENSIDLVAGPDGLPAFDLQVWRFGDDRFAEISQKEALMGRVVLSRDIFCHKCPSTRDAQFQKFSYDILPENNFLLKLYPALVSSLTKAHQDFLSKYDISKIWGKTRNLEEFKKTVDFDFYLALSQGKAVSQVALDTVPEQRKLLVNTEVPQHLRGNSATLTEPIPKESSTAVFPIPTPSPVLQEKRDTSQLDALIASLNAGG